MFGQLLNILDTNFIFFKKINFGFSYTELWFTDQNAKPPEIENEISITLVVN